MAGFTPSTNTAMMLAMRRIGPVRPESGFVSRVLSVPEIRTVSAPAPAPAPVPPSSDAPAPSGRESVAVVSLPSTAAVKPQPVRPVGEPGIPVRSRPVRARYLPLLSGYWKETLSGGLQGKAGGGDTVSSGGRPLLGE